MSVSKLEETRVATNNDIKTMKLYHQVERVFNELSALGLGDDDELDVSQLSAFDQYHYFGTEAVDNGANTLGLQAGMSVLDVGSGIGGPARHLADRVGCRVTALELQPDLNETARVLTRRCGLGELIEHRCGDILANDVESSRYDGLVSWLAFLHIPDRDTLYRQCFAALKPGAGMYVEDFYARETLTAAERLSLSQNIYCDYCPDLSEIESGLEAAGFEAIELVDMTSGWRDFVAARYADFHGDRDRHIAVHGLEVVEGLEHFYQSVTDLFNGGHWGGLRLHARRPK